MKNLLGNFFIKNFEILPVDQFEPGDVYTNPSIYEVLRFRDGVPLFIEDHYERYKRSCHLKNIGAVESFHSFAGHIHRLIEINRVVFGNVKLVYQISGNKINGFCCFLDLHSYPTPAEYTTGVVVKSMKYERVNPEIKIINPELRSLYEKNTDELIINEIILIDKNGYLTEGSRSNLFFIVGEEILTPPLVQVLPGVTRKKVFEICELKRIKISERPVKSGEAENFTSMFITGTSRKILPIKQFDVHRFQVNYPLLRDLINYYDEVLQNYINNYKSNY